MSKKPFITFCLALFMCCGTLFGVGFSGEKVSYIQTEAASHPTNYDDYKYSGTYYSGIDIATATTGVNGSLRKSLTSLIEPKSVYAYSGGLAKELQGADEDPTNSSNMVYFYTRDSVKKNGASSWNREHVWPQSLSNSCWGTSGAGADMLHIRPTYSTPNSTRGNLKYGNQNGSGAVTYNNIQYGWKGSYFEPLDSVKGDSARDIMYVWVAWYDKYGTKLPNITNVFQSYDVLMQWHILDKPDALEGHRNDYAQSSNQKNRNPFVDHPEYAWKIFGEKCSASVLQAAKEAYPDVEVKATGVEISDTTISIKESEHKQLTATILPENATNKSATWSSSNSSIASVSNTGLVTANKQGSATIKVKTADGGYEKSCTVNVVEGAIRVTGISFDNKSVNITINSYKNLPYTISPTDATNKIVTWKSDNQNIATVDSSGKVSAISEGSCNITVTTDDGGFSDTCNITCEKGVIHVEKITLSTKNITMNIGDTRMTTASIEPENADNKSITWNNSNPSVLECKNGILKGIAEGSSIITVTSEDGGLSDTCSVTVNNPNKPVTGVTLSSKSISLLVGNQATLVATVNPTDASNRNVIWSSSDMNIVTVDSNGNITAKKEGSATIQVKTEDGGFTDDCIVKVTTKGQRIDPTKTGCSSSIITSSVVALVASIIGIISISIKKRKEW